MKRTTGTALLVVLVVAITPLAAFAQGDTLKFEEVATGDGLITTMAPEGWLTQDVPRDTSLRGIYFANTESAMEKVAAEDEDIPLESGDVGVAVMVLPASLLPDIEIEWTPDTPVTDLALSLATIFITPDDPDAEPAPELSEPEEVPLSDELVAGRVHAVEADQEGTFIIYPYSEDVIAIVYVGTFPGEYTDEMDQIAMEAAANLVFTGTADDLVAEETTGASSSGMDGAALVAERCTACHSTDRIDREDMNEAGWTAIVDRMIGYGAQLDAAERQAVIEYLVATH